MNTFKFWGIKADGTRDLVGMVNARAIGDALDKCPYVISETLKAYDKIEIVKERALTVVKP